MDNQPAPKTPDTPNELRALGAFRSVRWYQVAATVEVHPSRLSQMLHGHVPMPPEVAERVRRAIENTPA